MLPLFLCRSSWPLYLVKRRSSLAVKLQVTADFISTVLDGCVVQMSCSHMLRLSTAELSVHGIRLSETLTVKFTEPFFTRTVLLPFFVTLVSSDSDSSSELGLDSGTLLDLSGRK